MRSLLGTLSTWSRDLARLLMATCFDVGLLRSHKSSTVQYSTMLYITALLLACRDKWAFRKFYLLMLEPFHKNF